MASSIVEKFYSMEYGPAPEDASEVVKWLDAHKRSFGITSMGRGRALGRTLLRRRIRLPVRCWRRWLRLMLPMSIER